MKYCFWCKVGKKGNVGDELTPYILRKITNENFVYKDPTLSYRGEIIRMIKSFLRLQSYNFCRMQYVLPRKKESIYLFVGSILSFADSNSIIWGAGFMNSDELCKGGKYYAVRGPLTNEKLKNLGFQCDVYGDPALLLPLLYTSKSNKKALVGLIPHHSEYDKLLKMYGNRCKIIDLRTSNVEKVIDEICSCHYILSSSLHGIIISQAYKVPAIWISNSYINTDGFKFHDYFSSVGIPQYIPFSDINGVLSMDIDTFFSDNIEKAEINCNLRILQDKLLATFPLKCNMHLNIF